MILGVSYIFSFFFNLVEKKLLRNFLSIAKMASLVYERENCGDVRVQTVQNSTPARGEFRNRARELKAMET